MGKQIMITKAQMQQLCRYEITFKEIVEEAGLDPEKFRKDKYEIVFPEIYPFTLEDLAQAIKNLKKANPTVNDFGEYWYSVIDINGTAFDLDRARGYLEDVGDTPEELRGYGYLSVSDSSHFDDIWGDMESAWEDCYEDEEDTPLLALLDLDDILSDLDRYAANKGKPIEEWQFAEWEKENYIRPFEQDHYVKNASEKALDLGCRFIDELCKKDNNQALHIKGYACYGGNRLYECDWHTSRDCILRLYEKTDEPVYANTLGYIYYYGRCTGGEPEYEKAFRYFEIAALNGMYEGMYKLADMYTHGYACKKSPRTAYTIYSQVYYDNLERFKKGDDAVFADAALRMGNVWANGIYAEKNPARAYEYYLQADYAAKLRAKHDDFFGNTTVVMNVQKALEETEKELPEDYFKPYLDTAVPYIFADLSADNNRCTLVRQAKENGDVELTAERTKTKSRQKPEAVLITLPSLRCCIRDRSFTCTAIAPERVWFKGNAQKVRYDYCQYDYSNDRYEFYYDDDLTAWIKCEAYRIYAPAEKKPTGKQYTLASIEFRPGGRTYDYICNIPGVKAGDTVVVNGYDGETEVTVVKVSKKYESQLGLPVGRFKKVVRKVG